MEIRKATSADTSDIADLYVRARRAAYAHFFDAGYLAWLSVENATPLWEERLSDASGMTLLVGYEGERIYGLTGYGKARDSDAGRLGEVYALHVDPDYWRRGIGTTLLSEAERGLRDQAFAEAILWVYEENERARRFYEHQGWSFGGSSQVLDRGGPVVSLRYEKRLDAPD